MNVSIIRLLIVCMCMFSSMVTHAQLCFTEELTDGYQNEIEVGIAIKNLIGKDCWDSLFNIPLSGKPFFRDYVAIMDITSCGELKDAHIYKHGNREKIGLHPVPLIDNETFKNHLMKNKYCFTMVVPNSEYYDSCIIQSLTYTLLPTASAYANFPMGIRFAMLQSKYFSNPDRRNTIAELFEDYTIFLQFALSCRTKIKKEKEYVNDVTSARIYNSMIIFAALVKCYGNYTIQRWCSNNLRNLDKRKIQPDNERCFKIGAKITVDKNGSPLKVEYLNIPPYGFEPRKNNEKEFNCKYYEDRMLCCLKNHKVNFLPNNGDSFANDENEVEVFLPEDVKNFKETYYSNNMAYYFVFRDMCKNIFLLHKGF